MKTILDVEKYWNERPCNVRHSTSPIMRQYSDEVTERKYFVEPHIPEFAEFGKWRGKRVLEIGCGIGTDTLQFAKAGASIDAVDLSKNSLDIAAKRLSDYYCVSLYKANAENLSSELPIRPYDLIYSFGAIHHSPNPEIILRQIFRFCEMSNKPTDIKLMVYNKWSWKALWILLKYGRGQFWKFRELIAKYSEAQTGCPITHVYSPKELRAMLERNGFIVQKLYKDHIFPYDIAAYKEYRYERKWYWRLVPARAFRWLEQNFGWHLLAEATC